MLVERCDAWRSMRAKNMYSEKLRSMIPGPTRPANYIQVFQESQERRQSPNCCNQPRASYSEIRVNKIVPLESTYRIYNNNNS